MPAGIQCLEGKEGEVGTTTYGCYGMESGEQEWQIIYTFMYARQYHQLVSALGVGYEWFIYCNFIS